LPDIDQTFILANIKELAVTSADLRALQLPKQSIIRLPHQFEKLGLDRFQGQLHRIYK